MVKSEKLLVFNTDAVWLVYEPIRWRLAVGKNVPDSQFRFRRNEIVTHNCNEQMLTVKIS